MCFAVPGDREDPVSLEERASLVLEICQRAGVLEIMTTEEFLSDGEAAVEGRKDSQTDSSGKSTHLYMWAC